MDLRGGTGDEATLALTSSLFFRLAFVYLIQEERLMSTVPTVSSRPSIWRLGMVDWRFAFGVYASVVVGQGTSNSTVSAIVA